VEGAAAVVRETYRYAGSTHVPIEPHCAVARIDADGNLTVWSSTQIPHYVHRELSRVLGIPQSKVRVIQPLLGGAFGGKSDPFALEFCVAKLAMKTGRPVKILYTREEVFYAHRGRHPMKMDVTLALDAGGRIAAWTTRSSSTARLCLVRAGYRVLRRTAPHRAVPVRDLPIRQLPHVHEQAPCGPKRGHGSVQPRFAFEVALDEAAEKLGLDPVEVRRRNFIGEFVETVNGRRSPPTASSSAWSWWRRRPAGRSATASSVRAGAWASPGRCTSAAPPIRSTRTRCRRAACW